MWWLNEAVTSFLRKSHTRTIPSSDPHPIMSLLEVKEIELIGDAGNAKGSRTARRSEVSVWDRTMFPSSPEDARTRELWL